MVVKFMREGGFAAIPFRREAEQQDLPTDVRQALDRLADSPPDHQPSQRRDGYLYTIAFERQLEPRIVTIKEEHLTEEVAPLIRYFEALT